MQSESSHKYLVRESYTQRILSQLAASGYDSTHTIPDAQISRNSDGVSVEEGKGVNGEAAVQYINVGRRTLEDPGDRNVHQPVDPI